MMRGFRTRHLALLFGSALLLIAGFVPWMTIYLWYYPSTLTTFVWSPFDILWNAMVSMFPHAPEVNAWFISRAGALVASSALYLGSALAVAGFAIPCIRSDLRHISSTLAASPLLVIAGWAGVVTFLVWGVVPFLYEMGDGIAFELRPFEGTGTLGIALALAGSALAVIGLFGLTLTARHR